MFYICMHTYILYMCGNLHGNLFLCLIFVVAGGGGWGGGVVIADDGDAGG